MNPYLVKSKLLIRLLAIFYDLCFLLAILLIFGLIFVLFFEELIFSDNQFHLIYQIYLNLIAFIYYFLFLKKSHQTPGMKICRLYLLDKNQKPIPAKTITIRLVLAYISILFFGAGLIVSLFNKERKTLYDMMTESYIYQLKKKDDKEKEKEKEKEKQKENKEQNNEKE